jgi:hypothetical protein
MGLDGRRVASVSLYYTLSPRWGSVVGELPLCLSLSGLSPGWGSSADLSCLPFYLQFHQAAHPARAILEPCPVRRGTRYHRSICQTVASTERRADDGRTEKQTTIELALRVLDETAYRLRSVNDCVAMHVPRLSDSRHQANELTAILVVCVKNSKTGDDP